MRGRRAASAAEVGFGDDYVEACGLEDFDGGFGRAGMEIVVKVSAREERKAQP